jgi:hypothetical protein
VVPSFLPAFVDAKKVTIVEAIDPAHGIPLDISISNMLAVHNTALLRAYASLDERARHLGLMVKAWAKARGIASTKSEGHGIGAWLTSRCPAGFVRCRYVTLFCVLGSVDQVASCPRMRTFAWSSTSFKRGIRLSCLAFKTKRFVWTLEICFRPVWCVVVVEWC